MDGLFEIMFIGVFVLASVFDAVARSRRKKRRMEEMDREETAEADSGSAYGGDPYEWEREDETDTAVASSSARSESRDVETSRRETSDSMVPEDLWAVLTGQKPPIPEPRQTEPARPSSEARSSERDSVPPPRPRIPTPVPSDRYGEGSGAAGIGGRGAAVGRAEIGSGDRPEIRPAAVDAGSLARRPVGALDDSIAAIRSRSRPSASRYVERLRGRGREGPREAVVLSEVLGRPIAMRRSGGGWPGEPD